MISEIITSINESLESIDIGAKETYGIARIYDLDSEKYPAIYIGENEADRIDLDDTVDMLTYHRVTGISQEDDDEAFDYRSSLATEVKEIYNMVLVVALEKSYDYDKVIEIKNAIPNFILNENYAAAYITKEEIETEEDEIISDEFGEVDYTRYKNNFNIFRIVYNIELVNC